MKDNSAISKIARSFEKGLDNLEGDKISPPSSSKPDRRAPSLQDLSQVYGGTLKRNRGSTEKSPIDAEPKYATLGRVRKEKDAFSSPHVNLGESTIIYLFQFHVDSGLRLNQVYHLHTLFHFHDA